MTTDQTQGAATPARMALINAIWHKLGSVPLGDVTEAADAILAALESAGFRLARAADPAETVTISLDQQGAIHLRNALHYYIRHTNPPADMLAFAESLFTELRDRVGPMPYESAALGSGRGAGEGE